MHDPQSFEGAYLIFDLIMSESPVTVPQSAPSDNLLHDFHPFFTVDKNGLVERYPFHTNLPVSPSGYDPKTNIQTKDIVICPDTGLVVRLFVPSLKNVESKVPLIVHIHGGGFCVGSALDIITYNFIALLLSRIDVTVISIEYRLAPEHPLPIAYEDSWKALKWIELHSTGSGPEPEPILKRIVDFNKVFLLGESAGANIQHNLAIRAGIEGLDGVTIAGLIAVHPFFVGDEEDKLYKFLCPTSSGCKDDTRLYAGSDPYLSRLGTGRVIVCVAEKDHLKGRGVEYYETLKRSGWVGSVDLFESKGGDHCFHMFSKDDKTMELIQKFVDFVEFE